MFVGTKEPASVGQNASQAKISSAWDNALIAAQYNAQQSGKMNDAAVAVAAMSKKRAPVRRTTKDDKAPRVLFCLTLKNPLRKLCIQIVEWTYPLLTQPFKYVHTL